MRTLPFDVCRCSAVNCPVRDQCLRYVQRDVRGPRTPINDFSALPGREVIQPADCSQFEDIHGQPHR